MTRERTNNHLVSDTLISRDQELFNIHKGVGFFSPEIVNQFSPEPRIPSRERVIWLPGETEQLIREVEEDTSVLVMGGLGSGKSALIYGLRSFYRETQTPYAFIDGHFLGTSEKVISATMQWAIKNRAVLLFDSLDYLIGKSRKIRSIPIKRHQPRSTTLANMLYSYILDGNQVIGTSHSEHWLNAYCDATITDGAWDRLMSVMTVHRVRGIFDKPEEIIQFYTIAGFSQEQANYLAALPNNEHLHDLVSTTYTEAQANEILESLSQYRIAKLIALNPDPLSIQLRESLSLFSRGELSEEYLLRQLSQYILAKNKETKVKMGMQID